MLHAGAASWPHFDPSRTMWSLHKRGATYSTVIVADQRMRMAQDGLDDSQDDSRTELHPC